MSSPVRPPLPLVWIGVIALLGVTSWFGWKALHDAKPDSGGGGRPGGFPPSSVLFVPVAERKVVESLKVTGSLRATKRAEVAARESAAVESIDVNEGDLVQAGAVIATLDGRRLIAQALEAEAALTAARAELTQREAEHARARQNESMMSDLWKDQAVAEREYLDSVRERKVAAAREDAASKSIEAAEKRRDLLEVRKADLEVQAPFTGRVVARHTELGEWLREGDPVVTMISIGGLEAWLNLPERHAATLKQTQPESVQIRIRGQATPINATEFSLIPEVDGRSRRFTLVAKIPDPDNALTPGSSVEANVPLGAPGDRLVVPSDAVVQSFSGPYVMIVAASKNGPPLAKRVPVELLFERGGEAFLAPGVLQVGDSAIVEGNERLFPNTPLDPHPAKKKENAGASPPGSGAAAGRGPADEKPAEPPASQ